MCAQPPGSMFTAWWANASLANWTATGRQGWSQDIGNSSTARLVYSPVVSMALVNHSSRVLSVVPTRSKYSDEKSSFGSGPATRVPYAVYTVQRSLEGSTIALLQL